MPVSSVAAICALQAFWLGLALPGLALLPRCGRAALQDGALAVLGRAYLLSFALFAPISLAGQLLRWPLWILSSAYLASVGWALLSLAARVRRLPRLGWPSAAAAIGGMVLLADLVLGARAGTHTAGDAGYHIARIRSMCQFGLNSIDPLVDGAKFDAVYPLNLYHALIAAGAQLTHSDAGLAWVETWPFAKLLLAAGAYTLAHAVFRQRWLAWAAATTSLCWHASYAIVPLPNTLAPAALLPLGFAAALEALQRPHSYRGAWWLAACGLLLGQLHNLNALFLILIVGPLLGGAVVYRATRKRPGRMQLLAAVLALGASAPWLMIQALPRVRSLASQHQAQAAQRSAQGPAATGAGEAEEARPLPRGPKAERFTTHPDGKVSIEPTRMTGPYDRNLPAFYALLLALVFCRRARLWAFASLMATTVAWLSVPALCTLLLSTLGSAWAVLRITSVFTIAIAALLPAAPLFLLRKLRRVRWLRVALDVLAIGSACWYGVRFGQHPDPWTTEGYLAAARAFNSLHNARGIEARRDFLARNVPPGAAVMAATRWDYNLAMHHSCHAFAIAPGRGWHGLDDLAERQQLTEEFYDWHTSGERRLEILRKYRLEYVYTSRRLARVIAADLGDRVLNFDATGQGVLLTIAL